MFSWTHYEFFISKLSVCFQFFDIINSTVINIFFTDFFSPMITALFPARSPENSPLTRKLKIWYRCQVQNISLLTPTKWQGNPTFTMRWGGLRVQKEIGIEKNKPQVNLHCHKKRHSNSVTPENTLPGLGDPYQWLSLKEEGIGQLNQSTTCFKMNQQSILNCSNNFISHLNFPSTPNLTINI